MIKTSAQIRLHVLNCVGCGAPIAPTRGENWLLCAVCLRTYTGQRAIPVPERNHRRDHRTIQLTDKGVVACEAMEREAAGRKR